MHHFFKHRFSASYHFFDQVRNRPMRKRQTMRKRQATRKRQTTRTIQEVTTFVTRSLALVLAIVVWGAGLGTEVQAADEEYDILIRDGRLLDGSGTPWTRADVAIREGRIAAVGDLSNAAAEREIDAQGLYVTPGFIDTHSHAASGLQDEALSAAEPLLAQGITTAVLNPDGGGPIDLAEQREALLENGLGVNAAQFVPHGSIRQEVIGMDDREATDEEQREMRALVEKGMQEGAVGLSTGPFYEPGSFAPTEELVALAEVAADHGGLHQSHIRDESDYTIGVVHAVDELIEISRAADLPGVITHVKCLGPNVWGCSETIRHRVEQARAEGLEIFADQYPYPASATGLAAALVPGWAMDGGREAFLERIADDETREEVREDLLENLARRGGADRIQFRRYEENPSIEGEMLGALAERRDMHPVDTALELLEAGSPGIVSFNMHERDVRSFMQQSWTMTASDGGLVEMGEGVPHPRNYGAFPRRIKQYVVEEEVTDLAQAIRSMTQMPATVYGLEERGMVREGAIADVVVFDLDALNDPATFTEPHQLAEGMEYVFVNGTRVIDEGDFTGARSGKVISAD